MKVKLNNAWFGPDNSLYPIGEHDFSEDWFEKLPSSAEVVKAPKVEVKEVFTPVSKVRKKETLKDFDDERSNSDELQAVINKVAK